jgi:hypothetical protein
MNIKLKQDITVPICYFDSTDLRWYHRDAKRILTNTPWNSKKFNHIRATYIAIAITMKDQSEIFWLLEVRNSSRLGEKRIIPMYEVDLLGSVIGSYSYVRIKRKEKLWIALPYVAKTRGNSGS